VNRLAELKAWGDLISLPLVAVAAIATALGYFSDLHEQKRQYTFSIADRYHEPTLTDARLVLFVAIADVQKSYPDATLGARDTGLVIDQLMNNAELLEEPVVNAVLRLTDFFNSVEDCVSSGLCDSQLAKSLLANEASNFKCIFGALITRIEGETNTNSLSRGAEFLSGGCG